MSSEKIEKLCGLILGDLDSVRFDVHDIHLALSYKDPKNKEDMEDMEFGIDIANRLLSEMGKIRGGLKQMQDLIKDIGKGPQV